MKKRIKVQGLLIFLAIITFLLFARFIIPDWRKEPVEEFFDILGILLVLSGFLVRIIARGYKEEMTQGGNNLVISGPYRLMRNPMYFGTLMIGAGIISVLFKLWALPVFLIIYLSLYVPQVNKEEKILVERFGKEYNDYCKVTPVYFPDIRRISELKKVISLIKMSWIRKESVSLMLTLSIVIIIEIWQDVVLFGLEESAEELLEFVIVVLAFLSCVFITKKACKNNNL